MGWPRRVWEGLGERVGSQMAPGKTAASIRRLLLPTVPPS